MFFEQMGKRVQFFSTHERLAQIQRLRPQDRERTYRFQKPGDEPVQLEAA